MQYFTNIYFSLIPLPLVTSYLPLQMEREILENNIVFSTNSVSFTASMPTELESTSPLIHIL